MPLSPYAWYLDASLDGFYIVVKKQAKGLCSKLFHFEVHVSWILDHTAAHKEPQPGRRRMYYATDSYPYLLPVSKDFKVEMAPVCSLASSEVSCLHAEGDMEYKNLCKHKEEERVQNFFAAVVMLASFFHLLRRFRTRPTHP